MGEVLAGPGEIGVEIAVPANEVVSAVVWRGRHRVLLPGDSNGVAKHPWVVDGGVPIVPGILLVLEVMAVGVISLNVVPKVFLFQPRSLLCCCQLLLIFQLDPVVILGIVGLPVAVAIRILAAFGGAVLGFVAEDGR
jgi:hypothetical protein